MIQLRLNRQITGFCLLLGISFVCQAQRIVTGRVTDTETGEPVPMASVYIAGTTVGMTTGDEGTYQLRIPGQGSYELVISHVGYISESHTININRAFTRIDVSLKIHELNEVTITANTNIKEQDIYLFWKRILGVPLETKSIRVINPNDVYLFYNPETRHLKASCRVPIQIVNEETGYRIQYILYSFIHNYNKNITSWEGYPLFEELQPKSKRQKNTWENNRKKVYNASLAHFVRSLYHGNLLQDGFMLNYFKKHYDPTDQRTKIKVSPLLNENSLLLNDSLLKRKTFNIPPDSMFILTCFGRPITELEVQQQKEYMSRYGLRDNSKIPRNRISNDQGNVQIFPDGTYSNFLNVRPFNDAPTITGLNMMLPIEYGMIPGTDILFAEETDKVPDSFSLVPNLDSLMQRQYPEKIYLTTDRSYYAVGDTIWLSAWLLNGGTLEPTNKSHMLHVELIHPDGSIFRHRVLEVSQGLAFGQIILPTSPPQDDIYRLRAYTRWSLNFNENNRFEKTIPIMQFKNDVWKGPKIAENKNYEWVRNANGKYIWRRKSVMSDKMVTGDKLQATRETTPVTRHSSPVSDIDLQFLPEGGRWVAGFPCRMAFKAVSSDGRGVNIEGEIVDDLGEVITNFHSLHQGMGSVFLAPQPGRNYHAKLFNGYTIDLPVPDSTGIVMSLKPARNDSLDLQLYFPPEAVHQNATYHLVAQSRGLYAATWEIIASRTRVAMRLSIDQLKTGIARFTLFTKEGTPCNERLVFVDKEDEIRIKIASPPTPSPKERGKAPASTLFHNHGDVAAPLSLGEGKGVSLLLHAKSAGGIPVQGVFTVSVTDSLYDNHNAREASLHSQMLLSSDLKGKVETPGWYFQEKDSLKTEALDLVMRTHGWSGYSWEDVKKQQYKILYKPETDYSVSGKITNLRNKGEKNISVTLWAEGAQSIFNDTISDAQGRFSFNGLLPKENTLVTIIAKHQKGKKNALGLGIELDKQPVTPSPSVKSLPQCGDKEAWEEQLSLYRQQKQSDEHWLDSLLKRTGSKLIKEVTIVGKRPVKGSFNLNGPGQADKVLYKEDIARYDQYDRLIDIIKAEIPQMIEESWRNDELLWMLNKPWPFEDQFGEEDKQTIYLNKILYDYHVWRIKGKPVIFVLNGRVLPVCLPANDSLTLHSHTATDGLLLLAKDFWNINAKEIEGIELMSSIQYSRVYGTDGNVLYYNSELYRILKGFLNDKSSSNNSIKYQAECGVLTDYIQRKLNDEKYSPVIIEVTTRSGSTNLERVNLGVAKLRLQGFTIPKAFYVPKYYPDNIINQAEYDIKPTLYWNPEVVTDKDGKAEINFPIGPQQRGLQIKVEGTDLDGGIGSTVQKITTGKEDE